MTNDPAVTFVHGFYHEPGEGKHSPFAENGVYTNWVEGLSEGRYSLPLQWYSGLPFRDVFRAWRSGHLSTYAWAYEDLAQDAARRLAGNEMFVGTDVICHSLGSRVVLQALKLRPGMFRRVLMLNGAETIEEATPIVMANPMVQFLNIVVYGDDMLGRLGEWLEPKLGRHGCIGQQGFTRKKELFNLCEVRLDWPAVQDNFKLRYGWDLRGDDPDEISDHNFSYIHPGNWDLYRQFLDHGFV